MTALLQNRRKAATVLIALGPERAAELMKTLDEPTVRELAAEVATIGELPPAEVAGVLTELAEQLVGRRLAAEGGVGYAHNLLERVLGETRANELAASIDPTRSRPFAYLAAADPQVVASALVPEAPQSVALALAHLESGSSTRILMKLPEEVRNDLALRIATLETTHPDVIDRVDEDFRVRLIPLIEQPIAHIGGLEQLVGVLNTLPKDAAAEMLDSIEGRDPDLGARLRDAMFVFEDLTLLDDKAMQQVLRSVDTRDLATALHEATEQIQQKIFTNLSERAAENLKEEIEYLGPVRDADVEAARKKIVRDVRKLEDEGTIVIDRGQIEG